MPITRTTATAVLPTRAEQHERITRYNWRAIALVVWTALVFLLFGIGIGASLVTDAIESSSSNMVPACTDAIADAGGICKGEPR